MRAGFLMLLLLVPPVTSATDEVQFDYMMNCQGCHLPGGEGFPEHQVPRVAGHMGKFLRVEGGREFLVQVPGSAQSDLDDARLASVLNWMLQAFSAAELPEDWRPFSAEEVSELRRTPLIEVAPVREQLINLIQAHENSGARQ